MVSENREVKCRQQGASRIEICVTGAVTATDTLTPQPLAPPRRTIAKSTPYVRGR